MVFDGQSGQRDDDTEEIYVREDITHVHTHTTNRKMSNNKTSQLTEGRPTQITSV